MKTAGRGGWTPPHILLLLLQGVDSLLYLVSSAAVLAGLADLSEVTVVGEDGTGALGHTETLKVTLHEETNGNLQLATREGLDAVDVGDVDGLSGEALE